MGVELCLQEQGGRKKFREWLATPGFAALYANALPGFFPLSKDAVKIDDDLAATMVGWRKELQVNHPQFVSDPGGTPNLENELWSVAQVINGAETPERRRSRCRTGWISGINRRPSKAVGSTGLILRSVAEGGASREDVSERSAISASWMRPSRSHRRLRTRTIIFLADMLSVVMVGFA